MMTAAALLLFAGLTPAQARRPAASIHDRIDARVREREANLIALRRDLHRHPELSGHEVRTSRVIAARLTAAGLAVRTGVGGHGVVGILQGGKAGPLVAYRADMDAVRSTEPDSVEFRSETPGVRHICGHDLHVTIGVGLAEALASVKADLAGSVMFIFQPAEEGATGAKAMLNAGLFSSGKPSAIFGLHTAPYAVGRIATRGGRMMSANAVAPGVVNDVALAARAKADIVRLLGAAAFIDAGEPPPGFSEDFGAFQAEVPGVFFFLGASNPAQGVAAMPHSPAFALDESAIAFGVRAMARVLIEFTAS
jgi:metal-dependent amidase/aminoacylase/carboxypeptidase family protein